MGDTSLSEEVVELNLHFWEEEICTLNSRAEWTTGSGKERVEHGKRHDIQYRVM